eukprot:COSAG01_NODE_30069_length_623_cov_2.217557_1_plen_43_part_01
MSSTVGIPNQVLLLLQALAAVGFMLGIRCAGCDAARPGRRRPP